MPVKDVYLEDNPFWYKDAIIYELHIKAFYDTNSNGIGDFKGLTEKLDYLENLGITAIWLLPFYPSPLKDDGYDIANYFGVHPDYGLLRDFKEFIKEAHRRGLRVITELVLNHTSDQHAWFQGARKAKPGSSLRNFYVWSDTPEKYTDARIILEDFENSNWTWDHVANAYYWHRFYSHQPDLNFENPLVKKKILRVINYWLDMGVDGFRLDAVPYLFEKEGTNCENLPETYEFLKQLRSFVDNNYKNKILLAEANQWPEDAVAYFGNGDECHMAFHFPLMPRLFMALWMEDRFPIVDIFEQTPSIHETCQWALFLRNHDELTLEMVSDEERDYMYRVYASDPVARVNLGIRRRLAPLLGNNRRKIELMNFLLFSLPGTPIIYYGDEIGMGDNYHLGDRDGVRTPMQWSIDRNAGFSRANPQKLYLPIIMDPEYHYETINVENQEMNPGSLLWWMKRVISKRKYFKAFGRGSIEFLFPNNPKILAFMRKYQEECILTIMNLSRFSQAVELDLSKFTGCIPEEVFSGNKFPMIKDTPYLLTLGRHDYYWFLLRKEESNVRTVKIRSIPVVSVTGSWETVFRGRTKEVLEKEILPFYINGCRWFGGKSREIQSIKIVENITLKEDTYVSQLLLLAVWYTTGICDYYLLPVSFTSGDRAENITIENPHAVIANTKSETTEGIIYDSVHDEEFRKMILAMIVKKHHIIGLQGKLVSYPGKAFKKYKHDELLSEKSQVLKAEQTNTSFLYGKTLFFKLYRRLDEGINPDLEIGRYLTEKVSFPNVPSLMGAIQYVRHGIEPVVIGMLQTCIPNQGDGWAFSLDWVGRFFGAVIARRNEIQEMPRIPSSLSEVVTEDIPLLMKELIGGLYLEMITLLGKRTAELHVLLSSEGENRHFTPEPFSVLYQRSLYQSMQALTKKNLALLKKNVKNLPDNLKELTKDILDREKGILDRFKILFKRKISVIKIRIHGDYHLGQVLYTGNDFIIIDFEGEPARTLSERRLKRSPLRDVASMIRSFHYVAHTALLKQGSIRTEDIPALEPWVELWYKYIAGTFLKSYLDTAKDAPFIPKEREALDILLRAYILEKAIYELGYELNNRPEWTLIPLKGIKSLLGEK
jgi:maltose alpha-D-glucosyltransferase / alpha-amylase